jgi:hypothetical protein
MFRKAEMAPEKSLFVPLCTEWFEAFASGAKHEEWRRYGPRWNEKTCRVGRPVTLSHGYSGARLAGVVTSFRIERAKRAAVGIYGKDTRCAVIGIKVFG